MKQQFVYDPLISKRQQYLLATQVCTHDLVLSYINLTFCFVAGSRSLKNRSFLASSTGRHYTHAFPQMM
jgi:hypothetical protein